MKVLNNKILLSVVLLITVLGYAVSCTHKDVEVPAVASNAIVIIRGTDVVKAGIVGNGDSTTWKLDKVHSNVMWETNYMGAAGVLSGRFNQFGMATLNDANMKSYTTTAQPLPDTAWSFDEDKPENTRFSGYVQMNQSNTGEPGRDAGCNVAALGTVAIVTGTQNLSLVNVARIETTKIEKDPTSADYIVTLNLIWRGGPGNVTGTAITKSIVGKLHYIPKAFPPGVTTYRVCGLQLKFSFNCRDFGVTSTSISDNVNITCNMNFNNK